MLKALVLVVLIAGVGIGVMLVLSQKQPEKRPTASRSGQRRAPGATASNARTQSSFGRTPSRWLRVAPFAFLALAVGCLLMALTGFRFTETATGGGAVLTMDVSQSMNQDDVEPTRFDAAVSAARTFLEQLPEGLRVGLVTFADEAVLVVPATEDRTLVSQALDSLERGRGTVIGDGLAVSIAEVERDRDEHETEAAAIVLLTDGRDTGSSVSPEDAAAQAAAVAIPVHTVVLGQADVGEGGGANVGLLQEIASTTGGQTFTAATAGELDQIYETLGQQLSTDLAVEGSGALFYVLAAVFAGLAAVSVLASSRPSY